MLRCCHHKDPEDRAEDVARGESDQLACSAPNIPMYVPTSPCAIPCHQHSFNKLLKKLAAFKYQQFTFYILQARATGCRPSKVQKCLDVDQARCKCLDVDQAIVHSHMLSTPGSLTNPFISVENVDGLHVFVFG
jgi:hypothetical protein